MAGGADAPEDVQATFCATLVDEWLRLGVRHAVVAPGSRSTPMALAMTSRPELSVHVVHDERVAGFVALGLGTPSGPGRHAPPALLLCTSGTAAANFYPAVVEAGLSQVPLVVLTADRPPTLRGVGAPQTIDQLELYGHHVRWFRDAELPRNQHAGAWRALAGEAWAHATWGPVQINLPFVEPLLGTAGELPPPVGAPDLPEPPGVGTEPVPDGFDTPRGVILVGGLHDEEPAAIAELHARTEWPLLADPTSRVRHLDGAVTSADSLLRHAGFARDHVPRTIVRIGRPAASRVLAEWTAASGATLVQVGGPGVIDPDRTVTARCTLADLLAAAPSGAVGTPWLARWAHAERRAQRAIADTLASFEELTEPAVARLVAERGPAGADLTVASSMPVRDLEWFGGRAAAAHANRGANGIDGVVSTALGRGLGRSSDDRPGVALVGDLAFVHDSNALVGLARRGVDLRVVVVDNDGGGIFSFLPQAERLDPGRFELLFGTPLGTDVVALARAHGIPADTVMTAPELLESLHTPGPRVTRVPSDRANNVEVHARLHAAVVRALT